MEEILDKKNQSDEEYNEIFYTKSMLEGDFSKVNIEIPEITKSMLITSLRNILSYLISQCKDIDFKTIINTKNTDKFITQSKTRYTLTNYIRPNSNEFNDYEKFCLWGLLNVDRYVFDLLYISRRPNDRDKIITIPTNRFNILKDKIKIFSSNIIKDFKEKHKEYSLQCNIILNTLQQNQTQYLFK